MICAVWFYFGANKEGSRMNLPFACVSVSMEIVEGIAQGFPTGSDGGTGTEG